MHKLSPGVAPNAALSLFGITGNTAYFGIVEIGQVKAGEDRRFGQASKHLLHRYGGSRCRFARARGLSKRSVASNGTSRRIPEPQAVNVNPAWANAIGVPLAIPEMPPAPVPNVAIVCSTDNVAPVYGPIDVNVSVDVDGSVDVGGSVHMDVPANVGTSAGVTTSMTTAMTTSMTTSATAMTTFRIRRRHDCEAKHGNNGHRDGNFFQHLCSPSNGDGLFRKLKTTSSHYRRTYLNLH